MNRQQLNSTSKVCDMDLGAKVKDKLAAKVVSGLAKYLYDGERIELLVKVNKLSPALDALVVTNARLLAMQSSDLARKAPKVSYLIDDIAELRAPERRIANIGVTLILASGDEVSVGVLLSNDDASLLKDTFSAAQSQGVPPAIRQAALDHDNAARLDAEALASETPEQAKTRKHRERTESQAEQAQLLAQHEAEEAERKARGIAGLTVIGCKPNDKTFQAIESHSAPGETPWLILASIGAGALVAFEDRLMIVKTGAWTSLMAGSLGGGRITTIPFEQITGIEYNGNIVNGVLEVLTPSYQGSANKDFWRGTFKSRNADSNDPFTLSNTLPLAKSDYEKAAPYLTELRTKCAAARKPNIQVTLPEAPAAQNGIGAELAKLAELKAQGVLDDEEFTAAKRAAISRQY